MRDAVNSYIASAIRDFSKWIYRENRDRERVPIYKQYLYIINNIRPFERLLYNYLYKYTRIFDGWILTYYSPYRP